MDKSKRVQVGQCATQLGHHPLATALLHADLGDDVRRRMCELNDVYLNEKNLKSETSH